MYITMDGPDFGDEEVAPKRVGGPMASASKAARPTITLQQMQQLITSIKTSPVPKWIPNAFLNSLAELYHQPVREFIVPSISDGVGQESLFDTYFSNYGYIETAIPRIEQEIEEYKNAEKEFKTSVDWSALMNRKKMLERKNQMYVRFDALKKLIESMKFNGVIETQADMLYPVQLLSYLEPIYLLDEKNNATQTPLASDLVKDPNFDVRKYALYILMNAKNFVYSGNSNGTAVFNKQSSYNVKTEVAAYEALVETIELDPNYDQYKLDQQAVDDALAPFGAHFNEDWMRQILERQTHALQEFSNEYVPLEKSWKSVRSTHGSRFHIKELHLGVVKKVLDEIRVSAAVMFRMPRVQTSSSPNMRVENPLPMKDGKIDYDMAMELWGTLLARVVHADLTRTAEGIRGENKTPGAIHYLTVLYNNAYNSLSDAIFKQPFRN